MPIGETRLRPLEALARNPVGNRLSYWEPRDMFRSLAQIQAEFVAGQSSAKETTAKYLQRISTHDSELNAFLEVAAPTALAAAESLDQRRDAGEQLGALAGVPIAIKDLICVQGSKTTCGSRMLEKFVAPYDATVIERLRQADAILIGKTNLDEFAMGSSNENSAFGRAKNPWDRDRVSGGSSGGSAVAVAADMAPVALGTDTGGSIRQPAAFCGITGLKPTYGAVSRYGVVAYASSLDQVGPMGRSAVDCAKVVEVISGHDSRDSTSSTKSLGKFTGQLALKGLRVGYTPEHFSEGVDGQIVAAVQAVLDWLKSEGAELVPLSLAHSKYGIATYYLIASSEASSNLERYDGAHYGLRAAASQIKNLETLYCETRSAGFGAEVKRRILLGTFALSAGYADAYYGRACKVRRAIRDDFTSAFQNIDVLLGPTTPTPPFLAGENDNDPLSMYLADVFTVLANLAGLPAVSFPVGFTESRLPIGAQFTGAHFDDLRLLEIVHQYQQSHDWHLQRPDPS